MRKVSGGTSFSNVLPEGIHLKAVLHFLYENNYLYSIKTCEIIQSGYRPDSSVERANDRISKCSLNQGVSGQKQTTKINQETNNKQHTVKNCIKCEYCFQMKFVSFNPFILLEVFSIRKYWHFFS